MEPGSPRTSALTLRRHLRRAWYAALQQDRPDMTAPGAPVALAERLFEQGRAGGQLDAVGPSALARPDREICRRPQRLDHRYRRRSLAAGRRVVDHGFAAVTVLDLSEAALSPAKARLGGRGASVQWIAADATEWQPPNTFDIWHDRAALHFLVEARDRAAYLDRLHAGVRAGGARHHRDLCTRRSGKMQRPAGATLRPGKPEQSYWHGVRTGRTSAPSPRHALGRAQSFQFSVLRRR